MESLFLFSIHLNMQSSKAYSITEATRKLEQYCTYQERCHKEVIQKLKVMRMIPDIINQIVVHLINENYLNEERFAKSFARGKFRIKKWGRNRILNELKQRDISPFNIKIALKEIDEEDYLKTFDELCTKRLAQITETDIKKKKKKLIDYLLYRGWESTLIYEKVSALSK